MPDPFRELHQAVHDRIRHAVAAAWPAQATATALLDLTAAALTETEGAIDGIRRFGEIEVACHKGCSWCCWLRIDVRAHEVFLILRHLEATWDPAQIAALKAEARLAREALAGLDLTGREAVRRPCLLLRDGLCAVYAARPAACRRYLSGSAAACEALWQGDPPEREIQHPLLAETGRHAAAALHNTFLEHGYDGYHYDLPLALAEALEDPACHTRWLAGGKAFSTAAESKTPPGFSQTEALAALQAALAAAANRPPA